MILNSIATILYIVMFNLAILSLSLTTFFAATDIFPAVITICNLFCCGCANFEEQLTRKTIAFLSLTTLGVVCLCLSYSGNLNTEGYVPYDYSIGLLFAIIAVLAMTFLFFTNQYVRMVNFFLLQMFYNLVATLCFSFWVIAMWVDHDRHPFEYEGGWSTFGLLVLSFMLSFGEKFLSYYTYQ